MTNETLPKWSLAVWLEDSIEEEGVIPSVWIQDNMVRWPSGINAIRAMKELKIPDSKWDSFQLIKVKLRSDNKLDCDEYDQTTTTELSEEEDSTLGKRKPKKKIMDDFILDINEHSEEKSEERRTIQLDSADSLNSEIQMKSVPLPKPPLQGGTISNKTSSVNHRSRSPSRSRLPIFSRTNRSRSSSRSKLTSSSRSNRSRFSTIPKLTSSSRSKRSRSSSRSKLTSLSRSNRSRSSSRSKLTSLSRSSRSRSSSRSKLTSFSRSNRSRSLSRSKLTSFSRSNRSRSSSRSKLTSLSRSTHRRSRSSSMTTPKTHKKSYYTRDMSRSRSRSWSPPGRKTSNFPMSTERFQKRVLYLLTSIREQHTQIQSSSRENIVKLHQLKTIEEVEQFERQFDKPEFLPGLKLTMTRIGGVTAADHTKKIMEKMLHNGLMAKMNVSGKKGKFAFGKTYLYRAIIESVLQNHPGTTECKVNETVMKFLKYAPERSGGGGRKDKA